MAVASHLREIIVQRGLIQSSLAKRAGIEPAKFSMVLHGKRKLSAEEFLKICTALEISADDIAESVKNSHIKGVES